MISSLIFSGGQLTLITKAERLESDCRFGLCLILLFIMLAIRPSAQGGRHEALLECTLITIPIDPRATYDFEGNEVMEETTLCKTSTGIMFAMLEK